MDEKNTRDVRYHCKKYINIPTKKNESHSTWEVCYCGSSHLIKHIVTLLKQYIYTYTHTHTIMVFHNTTFKPHTISIDNGIIMLL